jgi:hypothetical protein
VSDIYTFSPTTYQANDFDFGHEPLKETLVQDPSISNVQKNKRKAS